MKEELDVIEKVQPKEQSKTKKYIQIALVCVGFGFIVLTFIMAFLRKYGS
jgi:hypothetical protein